MPDIAFEEWLYIKPFSRNSHARSTLACPEDESGSRPIRLAGSTALSLATQSGVKPPHSKTCLLHC
jgi:hypothetical protein